MIVTFDAWSVLDRQRNSRFFSDNVQLCRRVKKWLRNLDLPKALKPDDSFTFNIKWWYNINDRSKQGGRSGLDFFEKDGNYVYAIAQFFPRLAVYDEAVGWQHKQFLGSGEFTLPFGDYKVSITVPADHIVGATGELKNTCEVLTAAQHERLEQSRQGTDSPVLIVTQKEAEANEKSPAESSKTWIFEAENVRDFAFASSRKFIWDVLLSQGRQSPVGEVFHQSSGPRRRGLLPVHLLVPLPRSHLGAVEQRWRDGVSDDIL